MRLDKFLADMQAGTRSSLKKDIRGGRVTVNGLEIRDPACQVSGSDEVVWRGELISYSEQTYYMLHKPAGVISATEDKNQKTVLDLIGVRKRKDLFPVGRLDKDTEGLLLITNDGDLAHRLLSPGRHVDKVYFARLDGPCTGEMIRAFAEGLHVDDSLDAGPADLEMADPSRPEEILVTIREGKFHQIKRMFLAVGREVLYLKRLSMGSLVLDPELAAGDFRPLTEEELASLQTPQGQGRPSGLSERAGQKGR